MQDARGDQCDSCGNLLNPTDLINPKCKLTGTTPVLRTTKHIFLDLPKLSPQLQAYITEASNKGGWSNNCVQVWVMPLLLFHTAHRARGGGGGCRGGGRVRRRLWGDGGSRKGSWESNSFSCGTI